MAGAQHGNITFYMLQHVQAVKQIDTLVCQATDARVGKQSRMHNALALALVWLDALNPVPVQRKRLGKGADAGSKSRTTSPGRAWEQVSRYTRTLRAQKLLGYSNHLGNQIC